MSAPRRPNPGSRATLRRLVDLACLAAIAVTAWLLWPASLGGDTRLIAVEGASMEPIYQLGDVVIARENPNAEVGDVIVFRIPEGQPAAGLLIIHRIIAMWPDGTYKTQGDNRTTPDPFHIASNDIVGTPVLTLPRFGRFIGLASSPVVIGVCTGLIATLMLWPTKAKNQRGKHQTDTPGGPEEPLDQDRTDAEARAWLDAEVALVRSPGEVGPGAGSGRVASIVPSNTRATRHRRRPRRTDDPSRAVNELDQDRIDAEARAWVDTEVEFT